MQRVGGEAWLVLVRENLQEVVLLVTQIQPTVAASWQGAVRRHYHRRNMGSCFELTSCELAPNLPDAVGTARQTSPQEGVQRRRNPAQSAPVFGFARNVGKRDSPTPERQRQPPSLFFAHKSKRGRGRLSNHVYRRVVIPNGRCKEEKKPPPRPRELLPAINAKVLSYEVPGSKLLRLGVQPFLFAPSRTRTLAGERKARRTEKTKHQKTVNKRRTDALASQKTRHSSTLLDQQRRSQHRFVSLRDTKKGTPKTRH